MLKELNIMDYSFLLGIEKKTIDWTNHRNKQASLLLMELVDRIEPTNILDANVLRRH